MSTKKRIYVCRYCGSEDILEDAYARWHVDTQQFELNSTHGNAVCENENCEAQKRFQTDIGEWVDAPEPGEKPEGPVRIIDANGVHPSALDQAIEEQRTYYQRDFGPGDGDLKIRRCTISGENAMNSPSGLTCPNGHGGFDAI